jgi:hypothetical protein
MFPRFAPAAFAMLAAAAFAEPPPLPEPSALPVIPALPDPLVMMSGAKIKTREAWREQRAPELRRLFAHYEHGALPPAVKVEAKVLREDKMAWGGKATSREVLLTLAEPAGAQIHLLLAVPNGVKGPAPVFLGLNFNGNHALLADPRIAVPPAWKGKKGETIEQSRGMEMEKWALDQSLGRGYAVATFWNGEVVPDDKEEAEAMLRKLRPGGAAERGPGDTATIAAWAWCLHRAVDYLVTDAALDAKRIAVVGHSRNGKTALLAAATDERIALVIPSQAGCGGTAPCRLPAALLNPPDGKLVHETVKRINTSFPHWFCGRFKAFDEAPERLPFDQHALIALCAPRPVLLSNATEDLWANPAGQWELLRAADPVYKLVAGDGVGATAMPAVGTLLPSRLGYFIRPGKHAMTREDWAVWLDYADKWLRP